MYELPSTAEIVRHLHTCAGFPTKSTWLKAISGGNYATWPHLTAAAVRKHFPESNETSQGHLRAIKQGIRSTKTKKAFIIVSQTDGTMVTRPMTKHNDIYIEVDEARETIYTDQTGAFSTRSRRGYRYVMIMYEIDNIKDQDEFDSAWGDLQVRLKSSGFTTPDKQKIHSHIISKFKINNQ